MALNMLRTPSGSIEAFPSKHRGSGSAGPLVLPP
jgi:hypothetical protein